MALMSKISSVCQVKLPVGETLKIRRNRMSQASVSSAGTIPSDARGQSCNTHTNHMDRKRICIVTGIHGDELEGQYICYEVVRRIREHPEYLTGTVDVYPAMNPLGIDSITRGIPGFDLDMNRIFPGSQSGAMTEYVAHEIMADLTGADLVVDIHASNIFLMEIPQIRINELHKDTLIPLACLMNVDFVWVHSSATVLESTLAYSLNSRGTPTLVVEAGVGMRITKAYCEQIADGLMNTMKKLGIWNGPVKAVRQPIVEDRTDGVLFFNAPKAGIFLPAAEHWTNLKKGDLVGHIVNPLTGELLSEIITPENGTLFTRREYPVVDEGSLIGRLLRQNQTEKASI